MTDLLIKLTCGAIAVIDEEDAGLVSGFTWRTNHNGYATAYGGGGRANKSHVFMHRLIAKPPPGKVIDHIDGNALNNRRSNLRVCTQAENCRNTKRRPGGHSALKGVTRFTTKRLKKWYWKAYIAGKHIGYFDTEVEAARAYDEKARILFGQFARLNFPDNKGGRGVVSPLDRVTT
jgi:hypothetical protein